jgi:peptidoglycan hydrolase CwlO-like protein
MKMNQIITTTILLSLLTLAAFARAAQAQTITPASETESVSELRRQFTSELRKLRLDLVQQGLEFQQWKIKQLERDLQQASAEQQRLLQEENSLQQEFTELTKQLNNSNSEPAQTGETEAMKTDLNERELARLRALRPSVEQRAFELTEQLRREETRQRDLQQQAKRLQTEK